MASESGPSVNAIPPIVIYDPALDAARYATGVVLTNSTPVHVAIVDGDGTQLVSFGGGTQYTEDAAAVANPTGTAPILVRTDTPATQVTTDGDNVAQRGTNYGAAYVQLVTSSGSYIDSVGGGTEYTEGDTDTTIAGTAMLMEGASSTLLPVQGTVADGLLVNLGTNNDVVVSATNLDIRDLSSTDVVTVTGGAGQTADVKVTLDSESVAVTNAGITTIAGAVAGTEMQVDVITMPTITVNAHAVTNAGTFAVQVDGSALTALQLIDDIIYIDDADWTDSTSKHALVGGLYQSTPQTVTDGDVAPFNITVNGALHVAQQGTIAVTQSGTWDEVGINDSGNAITVDWAGTAPPIGAGIEATALRVTIATDSTGVLSVDDNGGILTVDGTITANLSATDNAVLDAIELDTTTIAGAVSGSEMQVDVLTMPSVTVIATNLDIRDLTSASDNVAVVGTIADDATTPGNPVMVGGFAISPDGTDPGSVAEADVARFRTDLNRNLLVNTHHPRSLHKHLDGTAAYTDESLVADPGDGFQVVITSIIFSSGEAVAINFFLEEGATKIFGPIYLEAIAGRGFVSGPIYLPVTASTAVTLTTSAANDQSFDMDYFIQAV